MVTLLRQFFSVALLFFPVLLALVRFVVVVSPRVYSTILYYPWYHGSWRLRLPDRNLPSRWRRGDGVQRIRRFPLRLPNFRGVKGGESVFRLQRTLPPYVIIAPRKERARSSLFSAPRRSSVSVSFQAS